MNALAIDELSQLKATITALSKTGRYGEAVRKINSMDLNANAYLSSNDFLKSFIDGWICCDTANCCCDNCGETWCCWVYCCGFFGLMKCCGGEIAGTCCGCDSMIDECCF